MSDEQWEKQVMKKIRFMTNYIWNGISLSDVESFLANFGTNRIVGLVLMDMLIYYSCEQEEFIVENVIRLLNRDLWISGGLGDTTRSSALISEELKSAYSNMCFVPVKDQDPSDSAYSLTAMYKKSDYLSKEVKFIDIEDIPLMIALKKECFVFYDDIIGTGNQFQTFWNIKSHFKNHKVTLNEISELNPNIRFYYLVFGGYEKSINELMVQFPSIKIIASEIFTSDYNIFDENNEYWEFNKDKKELVWRFVNEKEKELKSKSRFSLNLPVLFQHSRASNTALSLYWFSKQDKWKQLYRR